MKLNAVVTMRIKQLLSKYGISQYELCKRSGVPQSTLSTILSGKIATVRLSTIYDLCQGLGIELSEFFGDAAFNSNNIDD